MRMILSPAGIAGSFAITSISKLLIVVSILATSAACNSSTPACKADLKDVDGDGYFTCSEGEIENQDCDDASPDIHPDVVEVCDDIDNNCDGEIDEGVSGLWYPDADQDLYGDASSAALRACTQPEGRVDDNTDCNDSDASINVLAIEVCDASDNNCDGAIDEGVTLIWYLDSDGDNSGTRIDTIQACTQPSGYAADAADCNDDNAAIYPGATETCDNQDEDCDGYTNEGAGSIWYKDADGDGYGNEPSTNITCEPPLGYIAVSGDCNDANAAIKPGATETCNAIDDNCDGQTDEDLPFLTYYEDRDGDGYGRTYPTVTACEQPVGYVLSSDDCADSTASVYPGAPELCNGFDDDCDDVRDEGLRVNAWLDDDYDGFGVPVCSIPGGYRATSGKGDCNDDRSNIKPGTGDPATDCCVFPGNRCIRFGTLSKASFAEAIAELGAEGGGTVWVGPDTDDLPIYTDTISLTNSSKHANITLMSIKLKAKTTLTPNTTSTRLLLTSASGLVLDGLTLTGGATASATNGGIVAVTGGDITLRRCSLTDGQVTGNNNAATGYGGAIYASGGVLTLDGVILSGNTAQQHGGALYMAQGAVATITGGWIHDNIAGSYDGTDHNGGGIYSEGNLTLTNVRVNNNLASGKGGGINQASGTMALTNVIFTHNYSGEPQGGAMRIAAGVASFNHAAVTKNGAAKATDCNTSTGGIWVQGQSTRLTVLNSIFSHNFQNSDFACSGGSCETPEEGSQDGMNIVGSSCGDSVPAANLNLSFSDFYRVGATGTTLAAYGISGSTWTTASFSASLATWTKMDPMFPTAYADDFHHISTSPLINAGTPSACTPSTCDPDGSQPDIGPYGGPGGAEWNLDLDSYRDWWWYDAWGSSTPGGLWDCEDRNPSYSCN